MCKENLLCPKCVEEWVVKSTRKVEDVGTFSDDKIMVFDIIFNFLIFLEILFIYHSLSVQLQCTQPNLNQTQTPLRMQTNAGHITDPHMTSLSIIELQQKANKPFTLW
jgi:hypothetical protein